MKIIFTKNILYGKIPGLKELGLVVTKQRIRNTIMRPEHVSGILGDGTCIASKKLTKELVLRVVYKFDGGIIKVITIYPTSSGRYY